MAVINPANIGLAFALGLFFGMLLLVEIGRRVGARRLARDPEGARTGTAAVEGALFGLLGLLIAFTFSGAAQRFDARRHLITEEANAVGTAWLRLDLLPATAQPELRELFRKYLDARLETYRVLPDLAAAHAALERSIAIQDEIWKRSVASARDAAPLPAAVLLLPSLNAMFDIVTTRVQAVRMHPPPVIFGMLGVMALGASLLAGYGMAGSKSRSWFHVLGFALVLSLTVYVIYDLEYPRLGLIRVDAADQVLNELRQGMNGPGSGHRRRGGFSR